MGEIEMWEYMIAVSQSLVATAIGEIVKIAHKRGFRLPGAKRSIDRPLSPDKLRSILIRRLRQDQTVWTRSPHYGQFGKHADRAQGRFQPGHEDMAVKPRMYLTAWPGIILAKRRLSLNNVRLATIGIMRLFQVYNDNRVHVAQSVTQGGGPDHFPTLISYRHTMCGAWFLYSVSDLSRLAIRNIIGAMLDGDNEWQNEDGGWKTCDKEYTASDIWASTYAVEILDKALNEAWLSQQQQELATQALTKTFKYFTVCWHKTKWAIEKARSEDNSILLLIQLAHVLRRRDNVLLNSVTAHMKNWLSPMGDLSDAYLRSLSHIEDISPAAHCARMSYALCRAGEAEEIWMHLYKKAAQGLDDGFNSSDLAFLLDLTYLAPES